MRPNVEALTEKAMSARDPDYFSCATIALATYVQELETERDTLRVDAARYRHMRNSFALNGQTHKLVWYLPATTRLTPDGLDVTIDAAIAAKEPK